jgi:UDP-N-acetylglucosamine 1-carboxyvinyltransferase
LFATLLSEQACTLRNVPDLADISVTLRLLRSFGASCSFQDNVITTQTPEITGVEAPYSLVKALRASFWALGPLLARVGEARVSLPGGDAIGTRPVDLHLKGMAQLGADVKMEHGVVIASAPGGLRGAKIDLDFPSVGATHNLLMCAAGTPGETILSGAAREPEVIELCDLLSQMGAEIDGIGTSTIQIKGRKDLGGAEIDVLGDRIEAVTYLLAAALTGGEVCVDGIDPHYLEAELGLMREMGCRIDLEKSNSICISTKGELQAVSFETAPHPGVATDVQPLFVAALAKAKGVSEVVETVFENRFGHVAEYRRFGADISVEGRLARITGVNGNLSSAPVEGGDIRAAAGLVLLGLVADGVTQVRELHHLDRGYEGLVSKLNELGAQISRVPAFDSREVVVGC